MPVPSVLCLSGLDPTGGAGLGADIETCLANGVHALGVVTALTVQDTTNVEMIKPVPKRLLQRQLDCLIADCSPSAVKIGLIGARDQIPMLAELANSLDVPVVCDPILRAGGGRVLLTSNVMQALHAELLPHVTILTPNSAELHRLAPGARNDAAAAAVLLQSGCRHVLVTRGDENRSDVVNTWYQSKTGAVSWQWERLPQQFHGAGCTLATAIAAQLAHGKSIHAAMQLAQQYTQAALKDPLLVGRGRAIPGRLVTEREL